MLLELPSTAERNLKNDGQTLNSNVWVNPVNGPMNLAASSADMKGSAWWMTTGLKTILLIRAIGTVQTIVKKTKKMITIQRRIFLDEYCIRREVLRQGAQNIVCEWNNNMRAKLREHMKFCFEYRIINRFSTYRNCGGHGSTINNNIDEGAQKYKWARGWELRFFLFKISWKGFKIIRTSSLVGRTSMGEHLFSERESKG